MARRHRHNDARAHRGRPRRGAQRARYCADGSRDDPARPHHLAGPFGSGRPPPRPARHAARSRPRHALRGRALPPNALGRRGLRARDPERARRAPGGERADRRRGSGPGRPRAACDRRDRRSPVPPVPRTRTSGSSARGRRRGSPCAACRATRCTASGASGASAASAPQARSAPAPGSRARPGRRSGGAPP